MRTLEQVHVRLKLLGTELITGLQVVRLTRTLPRDGKELDLSVVAAENGWAVARQEHGYACWRAGEERDRNHGKEADRYYQKVLEAEQKARRCRNAQFQGI